MKKNILIFGLSAAMLLTSSAFAMPSYQTAPDASTWGTDADTFTSLDYLQTSLLRSRVIGLRGNFDDDEKMGGGLYSSLTLPKKDEAGREITWTSSDPSVISESGTFVRPEKTKTVTLTASAGEYSKEFKFRAYGDYVLLDRAPGEGEMLVRENFEDGEFDSDIFQAITANGDTAEAKNGAYSIQFNSAQGGGFRIYHTKDHTPLTSGVYVEEFTFDRDTGADLGNFFTISAFGQVNHIKNGLSNAEIGAVMIPRGIDYIRVKTPLGGGNIYNGMQQQLNWGANGNKDGERIKNSSSIHIKIVYDIDNGRYKIYNDGTVLGAGSGGYVGFGKLETGDVDDNDQKVVEAPNLTYTELTQGASTDGVTDHLAISDYKFYKAQDRAICQYVVAAPVYVSYFPTIDTVNILLDRTHDKFTLRNGKTLEPGTPLKVYVCAYKGNYSSLSGVAVYDITVPDGESGFWRFNPYNNDAIRNAYKGAVKTMIFYHDENGNIIPVSMGDVVQY